jgi:hypothetical protein
MGDGVYDRSGQFMARCSEVCAFPDYAADRFGRQPGRPAGELLQDSDVTDLIASDSAMASGR